MSRNKYLTLIELLKNERRSAEELADLQNRKLRRLIRHAYHRSPFYRNRFDRLGISPDDIRTADDLPLLPIVTKEEIINDDGGIVLDASVATSDLVKKCTSGSSGIPFEFYVGQAYDRFCKAQYLRPYISNGLKLFHTTMKISSHPPPVKKWFQHLGILRQHHVLSNLRGDDVLADYRRIKPDVLIGYPSSISSLADACLDSEQQTHRPKVIFTDSELLTDFVKDRIRTAFHAPIIDVYGTFETDNIAWQCSEGSAYHYASDCVVLETIRDGQPVPIDTPGELVCTVLNSLTMPFIRYKIGDIATLSSKSCVCGRTLPLISEIEGRATDRLTMPDGSRVSAMRILHEFRSMAGTILQFQITQDTIGKFTVAIASRQILSDAERERIVHAIQSTQPEASVSIKAFGPEGLPIADKLRPFVSRVQC